MYCFSGVPVALSNARASVYMNILILSIIQVNITSGSQ